MVNKRNRTEQILMAYEKVKKEVMEKNDRRGLDEWLEAADMDVLLQQPFRALEDTVYGKKERYGAIVDAWTGYEGEPEGWMLLAMADTAEQISKMIYEHRRALEDLFYLWMKEYTKRESGEDKMAALAILKACSMEMIPAEHYAETGLALLGDAAAGGENRLDEAALNQWECIKQTWGIDDER